MNIIVAGDFNENIDWKNMQEFMKEIGLFNIWAEVNRINKEEREILKDLFIVNEEIINNLVEVEIIECNKIAEFNCIGYLANYYHSIIILNNSR